MSFDDSRKVSVKRIFWQSVRCYQSNLCCACRMRRNCYFRTSGQNSDITIRFGDPDFPKRAIIGRLYDVFKCFFHYTDRK